MTATQERKIFMESLLVDSFKGIWKENARKLWSMVISLQVNSKAAGATQRGRLYCTATSANRPHTDGNPMSAFIAAFNLRGATKS
jgi:hypothetical protein